MDWDPDDVSVIQGEWHPQALELLRSTGDFAKYKESRTFRFVHLFSGARDVLKPALERAAAKEGFAHQGGVLRQGRAAEAEPGR